MANEIAPDKLPPITLAIMKLVASTLADDIERDEANRIEWGWKKRLDPARLEQARVLRKTAELIDRIGASEPARAALGLRPAQPAGGDA